MKLYKYTSYNAAKSIIENSNIGFNQIDRFNDPFEGKATGWGEAVSDWDKIYAQKRQQILLEARVNYRVLSLTREPLNPLMWSHYSQAYEGVVIEFNTHNAGFDSDSFVIPASKGEVIYTRTKPPKLEQQVFKDSITSDVLKRSFLFKSQEWSYEEEVRIVCESNHLTPKLINGRTMDMYQLPDNSIKSVYLGYNFFRPLNYILDRNNPIESRLKHDKEILDLYHVILSWMDRGISVKACGPENNSWRLTESDINRQSIKSSASKLEAKLQQKI
ncbi:DUF2971 domain-containing protein [Aliivibrio fischeri]|uniref:DUF2971 domain-containing protein n=1 Tax=Aliivibrio fischeri TaxID=668 RepID=UPI001060CEAF|nr:DUF2971 domain-containing protein [Aliivibrio fischeri]TDM51420.1 DUF2971 domain-containing protein [Aliivibrio fischeri]